MPSILPLLVSLLLIFSKSNAVWLSEDYWTIVNYDGSLFGDRTVADFLTFDALYHDKRLENAYVAYWITHDSSGHYEAFGQANFSDGRVCARFVDRHHKEKNLCGGFRVLSKSRNPAAQYQFKFVRSEDANIHRAVEYRGRQIAKTLSWQKNEAWYGTANLQERTAEGVDYSGRYIKLSYNEDPYFYNNYVFILVAVEPSEVPRRQRHHHPHENKKTYYHTPIKPYDKITSFLDDEPREKWKFYHSKRSLRGYRDYKSFHKY